MLSNNEKKKQFFKKFTDEEIFAEKNFSYQNNL